MSRYDVLIMVPAASLSVVNSFMVTTFGDGQTAQEITLNAYRVGEDPAVATVGLACSNCTQTEANGLTAFVGQSPGCAMAVFPAASGQDYWAYALSAWGIQQVLVPSTQ